MADVNSKCAPTIDELVEKVLSGDRRTAARLLTRIERNDGSVLPILKELYLRGGNTSIIGITGPPGAGKSTLINSLTKSARDQGLSIAVLAVDPSSPFTGGAILGDRVRMNQHAADRGVFIRSMAARGHLGGLAKSTADAVTVLDAMGFDLIIIETVGVGQSEVDIVRHANTVLLVQPPTAGDNVQSFKSGIMEVADIFVVNKADLPGVNDFVRNIREMVTLHYHDAGWVPPIMETQASKNQGVNELMDQIDSHQRFLNSQVEEARKSLEKKIKFRVAEICEQRVRQTVFDDNDWSDNLQKKIDEVCSRKLDPYTVAEAVLAQPVTHHA